MNSLGGPGSEYSGQLTPWGIASKAVWWRLVKAIASHLLICFFDKVSWFDAIAVSNDLNVTVAN